MIGAGGCMGFQPNGNGVKLCEGLQRLHDEHPGLVKQMMQLKDLAGKLADQDQEARMAGLQAIYEKEKSFKAELEIHSEKEEGGLFPMMAKYIGRSQGPIAVMEYEHHEAKRNLSIFEQKQEIVEKNQVTVQELQEIVGPLIQACDILLHHFMKEENILFPMAEQMLNEAEKAELLAIVNGN